MVVGLVVIQSLVLIYLWLYEWVDWWIQLGVLGIYSINQIGIQSNIIVSMWHQPIPIINCYVIVVGGSHQTLKPWLIDWVVSIVVDNGIWKLTVDWY